MGFARVERAFTLVLAIIFGIPVSTTHTITGSIVGVGSVQRLSAVQQGVAGAWCGRGFSRSRGGDRVALCVAMFEWLGKL